MTEKNLIILNERWNENKSRIFLTLMINEEQTKDTSNSMDGNVMQYNDIFQETSDAALLVYKLHFMLY